MNKRNNMDNPVGFHHARYLRMVDRWAIVAISLLLMGLSVEVTGLWYAIFIIPVTLGLAVITYLGILGIGLLIFLSLASIWDFLNGY